MNNEMETKIRSEGNAFRLTIVEDQMENIAALWCSTLKLQYVRVLGGLRLRWWSFRALTPSQGGK